MSGQRYNVYDAYLYKYKKFILVFTYTPGFNINYVIDDISKAFNLQVLNLEGPTMLKKDSVFAYDKLNDQVTKLLEENEMRLHTNLPEYYGKGILIYGLSFPQKSLTFQIDLQLHFSTSLPTFLKSNTSPDGKVQYTVDDYNNFKDILADNKINKYYNIKGEPSIDLNNSIFDKVIDFIEFKIYGKEYELKSTKTKKKLEPISNTKVESILEQSKNKQLANEKLEDAIIDATLSIASDNADYKYRSNYHRYKKLSKNIKDDPTKTDEELLIGSNDN